MDGTLQARVEVLEADRARLHAASKAAYGRRNVALGLALDAELRKIDEVISLLRQPTVDA